MFAQNFCKFEANSWHLVTDARDDLFEELTWQVLCVRDWVRVGRMSIAIQKIRAIAIATVVVAILDIGTADHDGHPIWNRSLLRDALWHRAPDGGS